MVTSMSELSETVKMAIGKLVALVLVGAITAVSIRRRLKSVVCKIDNVTSGDDSNLRNILQ